MTKLSHWIKKVTSIDETKRDIKVSSSRDRSSLLSRNQGESSVYTTDEEPGSRKIVRVQSYGCQRFVRRQSGLREIIKN